MKKNIPSKLNAENLIEIIVLFFIGSFVMRGAGCCINDFFDRELDRKVSRTKNRPIASGKISVTAGLIYTIFLCGLAFLVLINFNYFTIFLQKEYKSLKFNQAKGYANCSSSLPSGVKSNKL